MWIWLGTVPVTIQKYSTSVSKFVGSLSKCFRSFSKKADDFVDPSIIESKWNVTVSNTSFNFSGEFFNLTSVFKLAFWWASFWQIGRYSIRGWMVIDFWLNFVKWLYSTVGILPIDLWANIDLYRKVFSAELLLGIYSRHFCSNSCVIIIHCKYCIVIHIQASPIRFFEKNYFFFLHYDFFSNLSQYHSSPPTQWATRAPIYITESYWMMLI